MVYASQLPASSNPNSDTLPMFTASPVVRPYSTRSVPWTRALSAPPAAPRPAALPCAPALPDAASGKLCIAIHVGLSPLNAKRRTRSNSFFSPVERFTNPSLFCAGGVAAAPVCADRRRRTRLGRATSPATARRWNLADRILRFVGIDARRTNHERGGAFVRRERVDEPLAVARQHRLADVLPRLEIGGLHLSRCALLSRDLLGVRATRQTHLGGKSE